MPSSSLVEVEVEVGVEALYLAGPIGNKAISASNKVEVEAELGNEYLIK